MTEEKFDEKYLESILQRNPHLVTRLRIHPWRWRMLTLWIIVFTFAVGWTVRANRENINELKSAKASVNALQHTNCGLRNFLLTAKVTRLRAAKTDKGDARKADLLAARGYSQLLVPFHGKKALGHCPVPSHLKG